MRGISLHYDAYLEVVAVDSRVEVAKLRRGEAVVVPQPPAGVTAFDVVMITTRIDGNCQDHGEKNYEHGATHTGQASDGWMADF